MLQSQFKMKKILAYPLSIISYFFFFLTLVVFHGIQWFCFTFIGKEAHKTSVDVFNFTLMRCLNILGTTFTVDNPHNIPTDVPCIFVSNHQGLYDIPPIIWYLRKHYPKFISKKELGKGIPGISYNLRHGGSALIDRKNPKQAVVIISKFADYLNETHHSAVIFPEGTRSRDGRPKKFAGTGLQIMLKKMPHALVVPITINNSWKLFEYGSFPLGIGHNIKMKIHKPILANSDDVNSIIAKVEQTIIADIL
ncbi:1-acyl-sn-glycerol-3-phosphate acyltransferase [Gillisia hiemivivida]